MDGRRLGLLTALVALALGAFIGGACLAVALLPGGSGPLLGFVPPFFVIAALEAGLGQLRGNLKARRAALELDGAGPVPQPGAGWRTFLALETIGALVLILFLAAASFAILFTAGVHGGRGPTPAFWSQVVIYAAWLVVRWPLMTLWRMNQRAALPELQVFEDHLVITSHLVPIVGGLPRNKPVRVPFADLEEIRRFEGAVEAQSFLRANTIPEVLMLQADGRVAVLPLAAGTNLLLRGPALFYLLAFEERAAERLLDTFGRYRS